MDITGVTGWRTASRTCDGGACVEAGNGTAVVVVRDTEDRSGPVLAFGTAAWAAFTANLKEQL
jgi:Domain of unknown function (DUF397)